MSAPAEPTWRARTASAPPVLPADRIRSRRPAWALGLLVALTGAALVAGVGDDVLNPGGWPNVARFWEAMLQPELRPDFLRLTAESAVTTLSFAVLGTAVSLIVGAALAPVMAARSWEAEGRRRPAWAATVLSVRWAVRGAGVIPRSINEIVWALILAQVLGTAPLVAVIAIGLPFGAVTAGVFADTIDESDACGYRQLRRHGAGRIASLAYGVLPLVRADLVSYAWYRFECAIRAAAILGIVGAGGLGYQIDLSFQTLRYSEMWTMIWALVAISAAAEAASAALRRRQTSSACRCGDVRVPAAAVTPSQTRGSGQMSRPHEGGPGGRVVVALAALGAVAFAWRWVRLDLSIAWDPRRLDLAARLFADMTPPRLGPGGWPALGDACVETLAMSLLAIAFSVALGTGLALLGARPARGSARAVARARSVVGPALVRGPARFVALMSRAIPAPVWVFLAALVLYPGLWTGVIALGIYNAGVMARLFAESLENVDPRPAETLRASGATGIQSFLYATLPILGPRLVALSVYRWEVIMRETAIVGVVGAAGIGQLIKDDLVARDFAAMTTSLGALVVLTVVASSLGSWARAALR